MSATATPADVLAGDAAWCVVCGDATEVMAALPEGCAHVTYCDPPYGLSAQSTDSVVACLTAWLAGEAYAHGPSGFMGKSWDAFVPGPEAWREVHRCLRPGGYCVAFSSTRTVDLLGIAVRLAGFEMREGWSWISGCLSDDTEILVDGKWTHYLDATPGRLAMCYDVANETLSWQPIQESFVYDHDDTAYRVHSDHTDQLVTRNHRCLVERSGTFVFSTAAKLAEEDGPRVPVLEDVQALLTALPVRDEGSCQQDADVQQAVLSRRDSRGQHGTHETRRGEGDRHYFLRDVRNPDAAPEESCGPDEGGVLLVEVQRQAAHCDAVTALGEGTRGVVGSGGRVAQSEDDRGEQPRMEGRGDDSEQAREPRCREVRPMSDGVSGDGAEGRLRHGAPSGGGASDRPLPHADGGRSLHEPRLDGQPRGEPGPLQDEPGPQVVRASRFARADLVRFDPVHYRGVVWCVRVPTGAFVARRNGKVFITGNSGFPKSLNISMACDREAGAEREVIGTWKPTGTARVKGGQGGATSGMGSAAGELRDELPITAPASPAAVQWDGYGTTTKPAFEPLIVARKALDGTVAQNAQRHGCGALNIDAARIGTTDVYSYPNGPGGKSMHYSSDKRSDEVRPNATQNHAKGRFPAALALVHDEGCVCEGTRRVATGTAVNRNRDPEARTSWMGTRTSQAVDAGHADPDGMESVDAWRCTDTCAVAELGRQSGESASGLRTGGAGESLDPTGAWNFKRAEGGLTDTGTAARFFYQAKASARDRLAFITCTAGCAHHETVAGVKAARDSARDPSRQHPHGFCRACGAVRDHYQHPTVKPLDLARYHARLLSLPAHTRPVALVPFCGTGIEARALLDVGFRVIAIDLDPRHCAMTAHRLSGGVEALRAIRTPAASAPAADVPPPRPTAQLSLFERVA